MKAAKVKTPRRPSIVHMAKTTVRLTVPDGDNVAALVRRGFANDLAGAVRFSLALARRWADGDLKA